MDSYKSPLDLGEKLQKNPFNQYKVSSYDKSLNPSSYFSGENKRIVNMSPNDYFKFVSHQMGVTPERLIEHRKNHVDKMSVGDIQRKMREGVLFDTPWLRVTDSGEPRTTRPYWQEGLHRMLAAGNLYGMNTKFPIYLAYEDDPWNELDTMSMDEFINHYDNKRLERYNARKKEEEIKQQEMDKREREYCAAHFHIPVDKVTPEHLKEFNKWLDKEFYD